MKILQTLCSSISCATNISKPTIPFLNNNNNNNIYTYIYIYIYIYILLLAAAYTQAWLLSFKMTVLSLLTTQTFCLLVSFDYFQNLQHKATAKFVKILTLFVYSNIVTNNIHCDITYCSQYILLDGKLWYPFRISTPKMLFTSSILRTKSVFPQNFFDIDFCFLRSYYQITF